MRRGSTRPASLFSGTAWNAPGLYPCPANGGISGTSYLLTERPSVRLHNSSAHSPVALPPVFAELARVLAPGGTLLVLTPNVEFTDPGVFEDDTHVHLFDKVDLAETLIQAGFEIVEIRSLGLPWFRNYQSLPSGWRFRVARVERICPGSNRTRWRSGTW